MLSNKTIYLKLQADFWLSMYKQESLFIEASLQAQAEKIKGYYFSFLQRSLPPNIRDFPIFQENFWDVIELKEEDLRYFDVAMNEISASSGAYFVGLPLPDSYAHIPYLYNKVFEPSIVLKEGRLEQLRREFVSGELVIGEKYWNRYNQPITNGGQVIPPGKEFIAQSEEFYSNATAQGRVISTHDYFIDLKISDRKKKKLSSLIVFRTEKNPFEITSLASKYNLENKKRITLFAPKTLTDKQELFKYFGSILSVYSPSSADYKNFLEGLLYLYTKGPTVSGLNVALNVAYGYPVAREEENIRKVFVEEDLFILVSDKGNEYEIRRKVDDEVQLRNGILSVNRRAFPELKFSNKRIYDPINQVEVLNGDFSNVTQSPPGVYNVFFPVSALDSFIQDLRVVDYKTEPRWWMNKIQPRLFIGVSSLPLELREDPAVVDFLFETYLKHNTFGVFINSKALTNFDGIKDFFNILNESKPTFKTYIISEQDLVPRSEQSTDFFNPAFLVDPKNPPENYPGVDPDTGTLPEGNPDGIRTDISSFISVTTVHDLDLLVNIDMIGMLDGWHSDLGQPDTGVALEQVGAAYDIVSTRLTYMPFNYPIQRRSGSTIRLSSVNSLVDSDLTVASQVNVGDFIRVSHATMSDVFANVVGVKLLGVGADRRTEITFDRNAPLSAVGELDISYEVSHFAANVVQSRYDIGEGSNPELLVREFEDDPYTLLGSLHDEGVFNIVTLTAIENNQVLWEFNDQSFSDTSPYGNDGILLDSNDYFQFYLSFHGQNFDDLSDDNNDGILQAEPAATSDQILFFDAQVNNSGDLIDNSSNINNGLFESIILPTPFMDSVFWLEGQASNMGTTFVDTSDNSNNGEILEHANTLDFDVSGFTYSQYYNFSDGSGTILTDQEGHQNGTLGNSSKWGAGLGGYSSYTVDAAGDVIIIDHNADHFNGGPTYGFSMLFESGSDVNSNRYFNTKDSGSSGTQRQFQWGFISNQLWLVIYLSPNASSFIVWKSTSTALLSTNTEYLLTITMDLVNDVFLVDLNGATVSGSVTSGVSIDVATDITSGTFSTGIGAFYQNSGAIIDNPSGFKFHRLLLTNEEINQSWIDAEVERFGL